MEKTKESSEEQWNPKGYTWSELKKDRYKKLGMINDLPNVQKVQCSTDGKHAVIKFNKFPSSMSSEDAKAAYLEAKTLFRLIHPNIIRIRDVFKSKGEVGTTFEYCDKGSLFQELENRKDQGVGPYSEDKAMIIFVQIALAFKQAHDLPIMHRNVAASNILLCTGSDGFDICKLASFGNVRVMNHSKSISYGSTSAYVPPETIRGEGYTRCGDVWGLGIILFQLASLTTPFETADSEKMIDEIKQGKHLAVGGEFSGEFKNLLDHMFKPEKEDRWTIDQILADKFVQTYVQKYVAGDSFKNLYLQSLSDMCLLNDTHSLVSATLSQEQMEQEFKEYIVKVTK